MRHGLEGYNKGCCNALNVWGVSFDGPNLTGGGITEHGETEGAHIVSDEFPYDSHHVSHVYENEFETFTQPVSKKIKPDLWPRTPLRKWVAWAAKVPATIPSRSCREDVISSATDGGDGTWESTLGPLMEHSVPTGDGAPSEGFNSKAWTFVLGSRAIYVDGKQRYLVYRVGGRTVPGGAAIYRSPVYPGQRDIGDFVVIDIDAPDALTPKIYHLSSLDGTAQHPSPKSYDPTGMTIMDEQYFGHDFSNTVVGGTLLQPPCNQLCMGRDWFTGSTYSPNKVNSESPYAWQVFRIKYDGDRDTKEVLYHHHPEVYATNRSLNQVPPAGVTYAGNYVIMLFPVREYRDSALDTEEDPDDRWALGIRLSSLGPLKLVTAKWHNNVYRPDSNISPSDYTDFEGALIDGTLTDAEVAAGNVILDASDPNLIAEFPDEEWTDLKVLAYNRCWDVVEHKNVDLLLFTTGGEVETIDNVIADFEAPESQDHYYLDNGLPDVLRFKTGNLLENHWVTDVDDKYEGTQSARIAEVDVTKEGTIDLILPNVQVVGDDDMNVSFWYKFDNRKYGTRVPPFGELTNFAEVDNYLAFYDNGVKVTFNIILDGTDNGVGTEFEAGTNIDNVNAPDTFTTEEPYLVWRKVIVTLSPGTHTLRWSVNRKYQDNGHLDCHIDKIELPNILASDDVQGVKRWYYDGYKIRPVKHWSWARRDEENQTPLSGRVVTGPNYITMDGEGRILQGNCHYVARLLRDGSLDTSHGNARGDGFEEKTGYIRMTASPNIDPPIPPCFVSDGQTFYTDSVADPPWGATQILPTGTSNYQLRGMNGALRDATRFPLDRSKYTYKHPINGDTIREQFFPFLNSIGLGNFWPMRANGWTVTDDGHNLTPHIEIIWRPTRYSPAWPEKMEDCVHIPYRSNFANSTITDAWAPYSTRPRNPLLTNPSNENLAKWGMLNYIISRSYSDAWTRSPQSVFVAMIDDPPQAEEEGGGMNPFWWDPDTSPEDTPPGVLGGPYPSARWRRLMARFNPNGYRIVDFNVTTSISNICDVRENDAEPEMTLAAVWNAKFGDGGVSFSFTDFDAVACGCDCGCS